MTIQRENNAVDQNAGRRLLWGWDVEREMLDDSMLATIYCTANCGFSEKVFFRTRGKKCPGCKVASLGVSSFNHRNAPVANETEKFALRLIQRAIDECPELAGRYFAKRGVICRPLGLKGNSGADVAILNRDLDGQVPLNVIACLFEIKMSVIWNWHGNDLTSPIADYDSHGGRPSIYRTDSILKATGKAAITRSYPGSESIPFVVVGNTPLPDKYRNNVDGTVTSGLIQKWISLTPDPLVVEPSKSPESRNPKNSAGAGFLRIDEIQELQELLVSLLSRRWRYMGEMTDSGRIGQLIQSLDLHRSAEEVGEEFLRRLPEASAASAI